MRGGGGGRRRGSAARQAGVRSGKDAGRRGPAAEADRGARLGGRGGGGGGPGLDEDRGTGGGSRSGVDSPGLDEDRGLECRGEGPCWGFDALVSAAEAGPQGGGRGQVQEAGGEGGGKCACVCRVNPGEADPWVLGASLTYLISSRDFYYVPTHFISCNQTHPYTLLI